MVNLNEMNFSKWNEWDGGYGLKAMNGMDYGLKELRWNSKMWSMNFIMW